MTDLPNPSARSPASREIDAMLSRIDWRVARVNLLAAQFMLVLSSILVVLGVLTGAYLAWLFTQGAGAVTEAFRVLPWSLIALPLWTPSFGVPLVLVSRTEIRRVRGNMAELARVDAANSA